MTKRLTLFEFISLRNAKEFYALVSDLAENIKALKESIEHRLSKENIDAYAPEGVRARLRRSASDESKTLETLLQQSAPLEKVSPLISHLENLYYILKQFRAEAATCVEIKAVLDLAKSIYPGFSEEDKEEAFQQATDIQRKGSDWEQVIPQDPQIPLSEPTPAEQVRARATHLRRLGI